MNSAQLNKGLKRINIVLAFLVTLAIDIKIVKEIGFAFLPMFLMSIIFFLISFLIGLMFIMIIRGYLEKNK
jgi:hypothetical protein